MTSAKEVGAIAVLSAEPVPWLTADLMCIAFEAAYTTHCGLLEAPKRLQDLLEAKVARAQQPMDAKFCEVYAAAVKAQRPVEATDPCELTCVATSARRETFMQAMRELVWTALMNFHRACDAVQDQDLRKASIPFLEQTRAREVVLEAFAPTLQGFGASTAKTMLGEAKRAKGLLEHPDLPNALELDGRMAVVMALKLRKSPSEIAFLDDLKALLGEIHRFANEKTPSVAAFRACYAIDRRIDWRHFS